MQAFNRYMIKELVQTFLVSLFMMGILFVIVGLVRVAMQKNIPVSQIPQLALFTMFEMSPIVIPMALLLSTSLFFARMAGNNEVIALKSLGIPPWRFLLPVMIFGIIVSFVTVWMNEMAIWGRSGIASVIYRASEEIILGELRTKHSIASPDQRFSMFVKGVENKKLIMPSITIKSDVGEPTTIEAQSAQLEIDFETKELTVTLSEVKLDINGTITYSSDNQVFRHPLSGIMKLSDENTKSRPSDMRLTDIPRAIIDCESEILENQQILAFNYAFAATMGASDAWSSEEIVRLNDAIDSKERLIERLRVEPPRRWATGFSCICFMFVGAPLAIWLGQKGISDGFSSFFACFIPILLLYYPLLMFGLQKAKHGTLPANSVWIANFCIVLAGIWFMRKIHRY
ncbi:MAG: LptF/LptG family permease [Planctomycetaceae bacterium]|jgi:lipopolysaccharide export system permease protein|nr:LptF/LptG family permease [Planctomycetaceae bacterium]